MDWKGTLSEVARFCFKEKNKFGLLQTFKWYLAAVVAICGPYNWCIYGSIGNNSTSVNGGISSGDISNYTIYIVITITVVYLIVLFLLNKKEFNRIDTTFKETYIPYFDVLFRTLGIEKNCSWTYGFAVDSHTVISKQQYYNLEHLVEHCFKCPDDGNNKEIISLCKNLGTALDDMKKVFSLHKRPFGNDEYFFGTFYKDLYNNPNYDSELEEYASEINLIGDLTFEVVRIANLLLDRIRNYQPSFMSQYGIISIHDAKDSDGKFNTPVVYKESEICNEPYPGLRQFLSDRVKRNHRLGTDDAILTTLQKEGLIPLK